MAAADHAVAASTTKLIADHQAAAKARADRHILLTASQNSAARAESVLRRHAPPELAEFIHWAEVERQRVHGHPITSRELPGKPNLITMKRTPRVVSNAASVTDRMVALNTALIAALGLQTAPLTVEEIQAEVTKLRLGIPAIETLVG